MDYLKGLNNEQREAVLYIEGPSMVIAGAGSGKTRVLTHKIVHLLRNGYLPNQIMVLTFTNKAAKEMRERIEKMVGPGYASALWMGTFHSIFAKILRREAGLLGYPSNFTIYDTIDSKNVIKQIIKDLNLDPKVYDPKKIQSRISKFRNNLVTADYYQSLDDMRYKDIRNKIPEFGNIFKKYELRLKKAGAMDFDDLLLQTNILFRKFPDVLAKYQQIFRFILVDEYQDTNYAQYLIIKRLAEKHRKICVVGDDAQSIYAFRGARIENIFAFQKDFPEMQLFKLEHNYRSTQKIVHAANSIISKNSRQIPKNVFSTAEEGENITVVEHITDYEEGRWVAKKIKEIHDGGVEYSDIAILYRMNSQSRIFEDFLRQNNIPYKIYGGLSFYQRKEIKDVLAYLRLAVNPNDDESLRRVINYPARGIGKTSQDALFQYAANQQLSIWQVIEKIETAPVKLTQRSRTALIRFRELIRDFIQKRHTLEVYDFATYVANFSGILQELKADPSPEAQSRFDNIQELLNAIQEYAETSTEQPSIDDFLQNIALLTDEENEKEEENKPRVNVMTVHSAKGLEFHTVFLVGVEQNIFPGESAMFSTNDMEEERRLFYVALTRAKKQVFISYAQRRLHWGKLRDQAPSQFIGEIDPALVNYEKKAVDFPSEENTGVSFDSFLEEAKPAKTYYHKAPQPKPDISKMKKVSTSAASGSQEKIDYDPTTGLKVGTLVFHNRFGKGRVLSLSGKYPDTKAEIEFDKFGKKKILLKFAKLQILDK